MQISPGTPAKYCLPTALLIFSSAGHCDLPRRLPRSRTLPYLTSPKSHLSLFQFESFRAPSQKPRPANTSKGRELL